MSDVTVYETLVAAHVAPNTVRAICEQFDDLDKAARLLALERAEFRMEAERLRALVARQREWIDGVMARNPAGYWHYDLPGGFTKHDILGSVPLITRPAPFEDK